MINIYDLEVLDVTAQGQPGWYESGLEDYLMEIQIDHSEQKIYSKFFDETIRQRFKITDYSHLILRVENDGTEFGLKIIDQTVWVAKKANIKH